MICKNCGKEIEEGIKFCKYCGATQDEYTPGKDVPPVVGDYVVKNNNSSNENILYKGDTASFTYVEDDAVEMPSGGAPADYEQSKKNGTVSMVLGIISCGCLFLSIFGWVASIVLGIIGLVKGIKARKVLVDPDRGKATAGFILSIIGLSLSALLTVLFLIVLIFAATAAVGIGAEGLTDLLDQLQNNGSFQNF